MTTKLIVLITDPADPKRGEVAILNGTADAQRLVETRLQAGHSSDRIRVFAGTEMEAQISQRPKVDLVTMERDQPAPTDDLSVEEEGGPADASRDEEHEPQGSHSQHEAPPAHAPSAAGAPPWQVWGGAWPAFSRLPLKPVELMPELKH